MLITAAASHPGGSGRLLYCVPETDIRVWLLPRNDNSPTTEDLLLLWLSELLGQTPLIARTDAGKPYIIGRELQFNVSHSAHWFAFSWRIGSEPVGIDVEDLGRRPSFSALAERYFHANEKARWHASAVSAHSLTSTPESTATWLEIWTRKEAVLKAHGLGLRLKLDTLDTCRNAVQHPQIGHWQLHSFHLPDAVVSVSWPQRLTIPAS